MGCYVELQSIACFVLWDCGIKYGLKLASCLIIYLFLGILFEGKIINGKRIWSFTEFFFSFNANIISSCTFLTFVITFVLSWWFIYICLYWTVLPYPVNG